MEAYKKYHHRNLDGTCVFMYITVLSHDPLYDAGQPMICKLQMASATSQYDNLRDPYPSSSR